MEQRREEEETAGPAQQTMATMEYVEYIETTNRWMDAHPEDSRTVAMRFHLRRARLATEEGDEEAARAAWRDVRRAVHAIRQAIIVEGLDTEYLAETEAERSRRRHHRALPWEG